MRRSTSAAVLSALLLPALTAVTALTAVVPGAAQAAPEPAVQRQVLEDDGVRIEELRVRGTNQRLVVRPKTGGGIEYEIVPESPGRDASQDKGSAGQRVWRLFSF
jgi:hypothetical protein